MLLAVSTWKKQIQTSRTTGENDVRYIAASGRSYILRRDRTDRHFDIWRFTGRYLDVVKPSIDPEVLFPDPEPAGNRHALCATVLILVGSAILLFTHLGTYALWDDESLTAMTARSVWRTGDTLAWVDDHNLLAYNNGLLIKGFYDRYSPPLQFYFLAPFIGLLGQSTFVCRMPFALCGLATIGLILRWMWRVRPPALVWWVAAFAILTNASFFLFNRQCRYYGLATFFSVAVGYCYFRWNSRRESLWPLIVALVGMLVSHYLNYAAVVGCLVIDYAIWGRHRRALLLGDWVKLIVPQLVVGVIVLSIWNPAARSATAAAAGRLNTLGAAEYASTTVPFSSVAWWRDYVTLIAYNWRDMFASDFVIIPLLAVCPLLYFKSKNNWTLRGPMALAVFIGVIALLTAHPIKDASCAETRYLTPLLPLCIGIAILAVWSVEPMRGPIKIAVVGMGAMSLFLSPPEPGVAPMCSCTAIGFYKELWHPQAEPYTPVAAWINTNVAAGASVLVEPSYMNYPLMFHAGKAVYAWQLPDPPKAEYAAVSDVLIKGRSAPDYLIAFGPFRKSVEETRKQLAGRGIFYRQVDTVHVFWRDLFRPERIWRSFETVTPGPGEEVYIYKRVNGGRGVFMADLPRD